MNGSTLLFFCSCFSWDFMKIKPENNSILVMQSRTNQYLILTSVKHHTVFEVSFKAAAQLHFYM